MFDHQSKFLIVDDAIAMRTTVINFLKEIGFSNFTEAGNGKLAFDLIESGKQFDIIFSDHHMPELTGLELLKKVRALPAWKTVPFFMLTSETEKGMMIQAVSLGASNYITKPVNLETIKAKLDSTYARIQKQKAEAAKT